MEICLQQTIARGRKPTTNASYGEVNLQPKMVMEINLQPKPDEGR